MKKTKLGMTWIVLSLLNVVSAAENRVELDAKTSKRLFNILVSSGVEASGSITSRLTTGEISCSSFPNHGGPPVARCKVIKQNLEINDQDALFMSDLFAKIDAPSSVKPGSLSRKVWNIECLKIREFKTQTNCTIQIKEKPGKPSGFSVGNS